MDSSGLNRLRFRPKRPKWEANERVQLRNSTDGTVATLAAGSSKRRVAGLVPDYTYSFRVRNIDAYGGVSANSTKASFTTASSSDVGAALSLGRPLHLEISQGADSLTSRVS
jgi:hypothetical protein